MIGALTISVIKMAALGEGLKSGSVKDKGESEAHALNPSRVTQSSANKVPEKLAVD